MRFYLKWINPIVAILILVICSWLYFGGYFVSFGNKSPFLKGKSIIDPSEMNLPMYFFAKGLFCSSMLFLFGEFFKRKLRKEEQK
ncbi:MAG: hypothetical protein WC330_04885 [Candidatus Omnitrophota bacterium]|jgi:NADH:ubiquinone oxidoreductase subunit H